MDIILTNNIDRGEFKIRIHEGIIFRKGNLKIHDALKRLDSRLPGILPFYYMDKDNQRKQATTCIRGPFHLGEHKVNPGTGTWCATKVDSHQNMLEWGYCIDQDYFIESIDDALSIVEQLIEKGKSNSYIYGYLKTYIREQDIKNAIYKNETFIELLRNKDVLPNEDEYELGEIITVKGQKYVLEEQIELGRRWKPLEINKRKLIRKQPTISVSAKKYGTNRDQDGDQIVRTYQGIIDEELNRDKRGTTNRKETIKECIPNFDYMDRHNKRVSNKSACVDKDLSMNNKFIGPGGGKWCATEIDDTGLMKEWGYCLDDVDPKKLDSSQKTIWEKLCTAIKYEQWSKVSIIARELLQQGYTQKSIIDNLFERCDRKKIAPYFEQYDIIFHTEFIKLYPWFLIKSPIPPIEQLQLKSGLSNIIMNKLEYLENSTHINELRTSLVSNEDLWLLNYYFIVERIIVFSLISESQEFKLDVLESVKQTKSINTLNTILLQLEQQNKEELKRIISHVDEDQNVVLDFANGPNSSKKKIDPSLIIVNYSSFFGSIKPEERNVYYSMLDLSQPISPQIAFYNKSFTEPKDTVEIAEEPIEEKEAIIKFSSNSKWNDNDLQYYSNYPEVIDPNFYSRLHQKKEFQINKMSSWKDKKIEDICRADVFDLSPQQQWVANFFNIETPYKGILLYWGTGVGKTCASISIAERHLEYYKKYNKKILVILGTSTIQNYYKELYNFNKEKIELKNGLIPGSLQCTGDRYYIPIESNDPESMLKRQQRIIKKIEQDYEFITYGSLKGLLKKLLNRRGLQLELDEERKMIPKKAPQFEGEEIKSGSVTYRSIKTLRGLTWKAIEQKDPQKEERIRLALSDYFSNRLLIVDEIQNIRTASDGGDQIAPKMLEKIVHYSSDLKMVLMSATPMFNNATEIVYILNLLLENDLREKVKVNDLFDSKDNLINPEKLLEISKGYISYVRGANPISFPQKLLPNMSGNELIVQENELYFPNPVNKMNGKPLGVSESIKYNPLIKCTMSDYQEAIYKKAVLGLVEEGEEDLLNDETNETFDINGKMISNIVYPLPPGQTFAKTDISLLYGEKGFDRCFEETKTNYYDYTKVAIESDGVPIIDNTHLEYYSPKYSKILKNIMNTQNGIIFVYSEYKKGGSLPFALVLEQNGFDQVVVEGKIGETVIKNKLVSRAKRPSVPQKWKYVLLDGDIDAKKRNQIIQRCNSEENKDGKLIKVIIGTRVASEGVDFSRIRQIHIVNPWDNFSRIDQTIGRGIRNCSHKDLPEEDRNVTVFLYSSHIEDNSIETTDEKIHRRAERKDIQMKEVEFILRNSAIDCISNYNANKYTIEDFGDIIGDKDDTRECGYQKCDTVYQCIDYSKVPTEMSNSNMDKDTYDIDYHATREIDKYKKVIKFMYTKGVVYKLKHIRMVCEMKIQPFDENVFFVALDKLITKREKLYDKYHRTGRIIFKDGYYLFQPSDLDKTIELPEYYRETPLNIKPSKIEIIMKEKDIPEEVIQKWYREILEHLATTEDTDEISYFLDRVKDIVMKKLILDWFINSYNPSEMKTKRIRDIQERVTQYLINKDVIILNDSGDRPVAIHWTREMSYEYNTSKNILTERINIERFQKDMIIYNFDDYNLKTHIIGRLEQVSNGKEESPFKQMVCKIIDFSFVENKSNIKLDGKACMSYNKAPMNKLMENLNIDIDPKQRRENQCQSIELALRKYNREHTDGKIWWIESNKSYKLEKIL
jgi:superfamily II DNA or RNA helicase